MQQAHRGVKGFVTNQITGKPIPNATVRLTDRENYINTTVNGEYWKILLPGVYKLRVSILRKKKFYDSGMKRFERIKKSLHQSIDITAILHFIILPYKRQKLINQ